MPSIIKGTRSYRKIAVEQETNLIGYKKTVFAHKAAGGETGISISSLTLPTEMTGFTNPSFNEISSANMKLFRNNVKITSSLRGTLIDYLSYTIPIKERIDWVGFTAEAGEIFVVEIDPNNRLSPQVVDASPLVATGTLGAGVTDFSVGASFEVNKYPAAQIGAVLVFLDGQLQFRNTGNATAAPSADGNYQEVDSGVGYGTIIRFNSSDVVTRNVVVVSNGLLVEKPNESQMSEIEKVQGQVDKLIQTTAALAGVPTTDFQAAPSQVQLQQFGDRVIALEQKYGKTDGVAVAAGRIGEVISSTVTGVSAASSLTNINVTSIALTPGIWLISAGIQLNKSGATFGTGQNLSVGISSTTLTLGTVAGKDLFRSDDALSTSISDFTFAIPGYVVVTAGSPTYYLVGNVKYSAGTPTWDAYLQAIRIA